MSELSPTRVHLRRTLIVVLATGLVLVAAWRAGLFGLGDRRALIAAIDRARATRFVSVLFVFIYAVAAAVGVPATPLTLAGGALFGPAWGIAINWTGEMLAALLAFGATRMTGVRAGRHRPGEDDAALRLRESRAFATLIRLRLIPVVPFSLLNAGAAVSGMSWRDFALATAFGIVPVTAIYTLSSAEFVAGVAGSGAHAFVTAAISAAVLIALSFVPSLLRRAGRY